MGFVYKYIGQSTNGEPPYKSIYKCLIYIFLILISYIVTYDIEINKAYAVTLCSNCTEFDVYYKT